MSEEFPSRAGAFGRWWRVYDEVLDPRVVRQSTPVSCHSACGEMLSEGRINQAQLLEVLGEGMKTYPALVRALNLLDSQTYQGGFCLPEDLTLLLQLPRWLAFVLSAQPSAAHVVVVEQTEGSRIRILDPWEGTKYTVEKQDFVEEIWSGIAIWREAL